MATKEVTSDLGNAEAAGRVGVVPNGVIDDPLVLVADRGFGKTSLCDDVGRGGLGFKLLELLVDLRKRGTLGGMVTAMKSSASIVSSSTIHGDCM